MRWADVRKYHREALLTPYFNTEMLQSDPRNFLRLLHFRTKHDFYDFVMLDKQEQTTVFQRGLLGVDYNDNCVEMRPTICYGLLSAEPFDPEKAHKWERVGYPRAKLIIDAQVALYRNLRQLTQLLLTSHSKICGNKGLWNEFVTQSCRINLNEEQRAPFSLRALSGPVFIDPDYLCELAASRHSEADDHYGLCRPTQHMRRMSFEPS